MGNRRGTGQGQAGHYRENGGEGDRGDEAEEQIAAHGAGQVDGDHVGAADDGTGHVLEVRVGADQQDRAEADDEGQDVEVADESGGVEHALARFLGVGHGEEAHQDVRQAGGTEHQCQAQGNRRDRVGNQTARAHDLRAFLVDLHRFGEQAAEIEADGLHHHDGHEAGARQQQDRLDDLHPGGRQHAAEQHVHDHQHTDQHHSHVVVQAEQQLDQLAGTDHLRDQVEGHHDQRAECREQTDLRLAEAIGRHVGEGELAQVAQAFSHQEQDDRPTDEEADGVDQAVIAAGVDQRGNAQEGRRRHEVAGNRQTILEAGDAAAGSVVVSGRGVALGRPLGDAHGEHDEHHEHDDGGVIGGLLLNFAGNSIGEQRGRDCQQQGSHQETQDHYFCASLRISWLMRSNSPLARCT